VFCNAALHCRAARLTVTYAGFSGESELLEDLYKRGLQQPKVAPDLHAGDGILMFWSHVPVAPWQDDAWLAEMRRSLRPNQYLRMIENRFVTSESSFISMAEWDRCVASIGHLPHNKTTPLFIGVDASTKHDSSAIVCVARDGFAGQYYRLATHRVFQPSPDDPLNFETTIEAALLDLHKRYNIAQVLYDPFQMQSTAQRLRDAGLPIEEFPQTVPNLTAASQNLYDLIQTQQLAVYPDEAMRLAVSRSVAKETTRGWRIGKDMQTHKIDVVVALAMACYAAVQNQSKLSPSQQKYIKSIGPAFRPETEPQPQSKGKEAEPQSWDDYSAHGPCIVKKVNEPEKPMSDTSRLHDIYAGFETRGKVLGR